MLKLSIPEQGGPMMTLKVPNPKVGSPEPSLRKAESENK